MRAVHATPARAAMIVFLLLIPVSGALPMNARVDTRRELDPVTTRNAAVPMLVCAPWYPACRSSPNSFPPRWSSRSVDQTEALRQWVLCVNAWNALRRANVDAVQGRVRPAMAAPFGHCGPPPVVGQTGRRSAPRWRSPPLPSLFT